MVHVLEHMSNPKNVLNKISKIINTGGFLYIEVPNLKTPYLNLMKNYFQIYHTYYFTDNTLQNLMLKSGFKPIKIQSINNHSIGILAKKSKSKKLNQVKYDSYKNILRRLRKYKGIYKLKLLVKRLLGKHQ